MVELLGTSIPSFEAEPSRSTGVAGQGLCAEGASGCWCPGTHHQRGQGHSLAGTSTHTVVQHLQPRGSRIDPGVVVDMLSGGVSCQAPFWHAVCEAWDEASSQAEHAVLQSAGPSDGCVAWRLSIATTVDRVRSRGTSCLTPLCQVNTLLQEKGVSTDNHVLIEELVFSGGGMHYALR